MSGRFGPFRAKSRGQALVYVSLVMVTLIAFAMLVTDVGLLYVNRRAMQNAVDAAALAGAQNLPANPNDLNGARPVACTYATVKNDVSGMTVDCSNQVPDGTGSCAPTTNPGIDILVCHTYRDNDTVRVTAHKEFQPIQLPGFGWLTADIKTQATAVIGSLKSACISPLFQTMDTLDPAVVSAGNGVILNQLTKLKTVVTVHGNGLALQLTGNNGANTWAGLMADYTRCQGPNAPQTAGYAITNPGDMTGKLDDAIQPRVTAANNLSTSQCKTAALTDTTQYSVHSDGTVWNVQSNTQLTLQNCPRMIVIPLLAGSIQDYNGSKPGKITGFLTFFIYDWCGNKHCPTDGSLQKSEIDGYFLGMVAAGDVNFQGYDGLGTRVVALIG